MGTNEGRRLNRCVTTLNVIMGTTFMLVVLVSMQAVLCDPRKDLEWNKGLEIGGKRLRRSPGWLRNAIVELAPIAEKEINCDENCWYNDWKHRDERARKADMFDSRCYYGHLGGRCYCYGEPHC